MDTWVASSDCLGFKMFIFFHYTYVYDCICTDTYIFNILLHVDTSVFVTLTIKSWAFFPLSLRILQKPPLNSCIVLHHGIHHNLFSYSSLLDIQVGCFQFFALINNAVMSTREHKSLSASLNASSGQLPRRGIPGSKRLSIFQAHRTYCQIAIQKDCPHLHSHQWLVRGPTSLHVATISNRISFSFANLWDRNQTSFLFGFYY